MRSLSDWISSALSRIVSARPLGLLVILPRLLLAIDADGRPVDVRHLFDPTLQVAGQGRCVGSRVQKPADFDELTVKLEAARKQRDAQAERIRQAEAHVLLRRSGGMVTHD